MKYNRNYGKLDSDQQLIYAPQSVEVGNTWYIPASGTLLESLGWMKVIDTPYPTDGKSYTSHWEVKFKQVVKVWVEIPQPIPEPLTPAQERERAYRTRLMIVYPENSNELITVDKAREVCDEYCYEDTKRAKEIIIYLTHEITVAKEQIREEFPDE